MGQRQVREGDTVDDGSREDQVMNQAVAEAGDGARNGERDGPVRRALIRATLKHPDGTPAPPRDPPVFTMHQQTGGNGWDAPPQAGKQVPGRGGQPRSFNDRRHAGGAPGAPGNNRSSGNQAQPNGRPGSKPRSSRRGRGRSR
jgi:hypothetical protein